jgi:Mitochondrial ribosomal protein mL59
MYSLRRQGLLVKLAKKNGVEELLPYTPKLSWVKQEKRIRFGLRVKGTGVGQRVKGKQWERRIKGTLEERREAMRKMPEMIREWKEVSHFMQWIGCSFGWKLTNLTERTWSWLEEMAEIIGIPSPYWMEESCSKVSQGGLSPTYSRVKRSDYPFCIRQRRPFFGSWRATEICTDTVMAPELHLASSPLYNTILLRIPCTINVRGDRKNSSTPAL